VTPLPKFFVLTAVWRKKIEDFFSLDIPARAGIRAVSKGMNFRFHGNEATVRQGIKSKTPFISLGLFPPPKIRKPIRKL
jgi:hypothetical protein